MQAKKKPHISEWEYKRVPYKPLCLEAYCEFLFEEITRIPNATLKVEF